MTSRAFRAMNTDWWLQVDCAADLREVESLVRDAEARLSRFRPNSVLSRLNRERSIHDAPLAAILRRAQALREVTAGAFDPAVGSALLAAGYARSFDELGATLVSRSAGRPPVVEVTIRGADVALAGTGDIDLGGIAKGWTVDQVAALLVARNARSFVIDGGGDIRVAGDHVGTPWTVGVGDGLAVNLRAGAVCTSSRRRRRWETDQGTAHHIIDPSTLAPAAGAVDEAVVVASDAATADALATAVIASPARGVAAVERLGCAAMLRGASDAWWMTPRMAGYFR